MRCDMSFIKIIWFDLDGADRLCDAMATGDERKRKATAALSASFGITVILTYRLIKLLEFQIQSFQNSQ